MEFFIFMSIIVGLVIWFSVASEFASIASEKGYDNSKYFWYTLFLGIIGMLMVIALPNRNSNIGIIRGTVHATNDFNTSENNNDSNCFSETNYVQNMRKTTYKPIKQRTLMWWYIKDVFKRLCGGWKK